MRRLGLPQRTACNLHRIGRLARTGTRARSRTRSRELRWLGRPDV